MLANHVGFDFLLLVLLFSLDLSFSHLVHNHLATLLKCLLSLQFSLLLGLKDFEPLDFHHQVKLFLFLFVFLLQDLRLLKLLVSDSDDLRVEDHFVHVLDVVHLFVKQHLCSGQDHLLALLVLQADIA